MRPGDAEVGEPCDVPTIAAASRFFRPGDGAHPVKDGEKDLVAQIEVTPIDAGDAWSRLCYGQSQVALNEVLREGSRVG